MRKIILGLAVTLDGFIEGPNGEYDWCFSPPKEEMTEFMNRIDSVFLGRKTYEMTLSMPGGGGGMPNLKEYVFSNTLESVKKGELVKGDLVTEVGKIKKEAGKDIWLFGGAGLTTSLINLKLVDEISLAIHPILLGAGKPLFNNIKDRVGLKLIDSRVYPNGLVSLKYGLKA